MTAIIIIVVIALFMLFGASASRAAAHSPLPRPPLSRRDVPLDPIIDPGLDPLIEPWADDVQVRLRSDELISDDTPVTPGGGDFGGGGASGDWDGDSSDESSGSDD
ncbi:MAG: hypothetical protein RLZZ331_2004 [Pseudomonadota bacterium]|jgi:hypothetical protein|uniref:hypothetical protein n=1 Tax=Sandarakinorhabdus limnophila TaxID=210512 RepID=UPI0026F270A7|nr:hypothetical protein [Sandarakinorhabdus limnophila]